jgi:hypothetical protein
VANTNTLTTVIPQLLAQGLIALREFAVMPQLVNRAYEAEGGQRGSTIDIPIPSAITTNTVSPSNTPPDDSGVVPTSVPISLDQWIEAPFFMSDKDMLEAQSGTIPMQASEAIKALANNVDNYILDLFDEVWGSAGVAGTTPFASDPSEFLDARKVLNNQLAPMDPRRMVIDTDAEANALGLRAFQDVSFRGDTGGILRGTIGTKFGSDWFMSQNVRSHTKGTQNGSYIINNGLIVVGTTVLTIDGGSGTILKGDLFSVAGDSQQHVVVSTVGGSTVTSITMEPGLGSAIVDGAALTFVDTTGVQNLAFHRDAFAFVSRPFADSDPMNLGDFRSAVDPVSGLTLRLEVSRQHKRTRFAYDILYGARTIRPELACRLLG